MPSKRTILVLLARGELLEALDRYELVVSDRRVKNELVHALGASHRAKLDEILPTLSRDRLMVICRDLGLDDAERDKGFANSPHHGRRS